MISRIIEKAKKENKKVYIYAHKFPDGDAVSSATSLVEYLKSNGIEANYVVTNLVTTYTQIVGTVPITKSVDQNAISLIVDTGTVDYAENKMFLKTAPQDTFVIDHHAKSKGRLSIEEELKLLEENVLRDSSASSVCEILAKDFEKSKISPRIADLLTLGLMTDTAKLKFIKQDTLKNLQTLLDVGANYEYIASVCTRKGNLKNEVGLAKLFLGVQKFDIGDAFGLILPVSNESVKLMERQYGVRAVQKRIFKMCDMENCSFNCMIAENTPGEFDLEFRSSLVYGNLDVQKLAIMYGGGGHYNASGCHFSEKSGYNQDVITSTIIRKATDTYSEQTIGLRKRELTDKDKELAGVLDDTARLTKGVTPSILSKVDELNKNGANYDYVIQEFKTFQRFMLRNELLSRIPSDVYNQRNPIVNINLSKQDVLALMQKYNIREEELLDLIDIFSDINIQSASIKLPSGKKTSIDRRGNISRKQIDLTVEREEK